MKPASLYMQQYRKQLAGRFCECGSPAVGNFQGFFECARCRELETLRANREHRRAMVGVATPPPSRVRVVVERFTAAVVERGQEIVILAHGEYHLNLAPSGE